MKKLLLLGACFWSLQAHATTILMEGHDNIPEVWEFGSSALTFPGRTFQYTTTLNQKNQMAIIHLPKDDTHPYEQVITFSYQSKKRIKMSVGDVTVSLNTQSSDIVKIEGPKPPGYTYYVRLFPNDKAYQTWKEHNQEP